MPLLMLIGVMGAFVVPLNALLQEQGKKRRGGNAIAVQRHARKQRHVVDAGHLLAGGNDSILVVPIGIGFGALFALAITALWIWQRRH